MFRAQSRITKGWVTSPYKFKDGDEAWWHSQSENDAHEFSTRKEARDTLVRINGNDQSVLANYKIVGRKGF